MGKVFRVQGTFQMGHHQQKFSKEFATKDEATARELCLSTFGSKHGVPRRLIRIDSIAEVAIADVADPVVKHQAEAA